MVEFKEKLPVRTTSSHLIVQLEKKKKKKKLHEKHQNVGSSFCDHISRRNFRLVIFISFLRHFEHFLCVVMDYGGDCCLSYCQICVKNVQVTVDLTLGHVSKLCLRHCFFPFQNMSSFTQQFNEWILTVLS